MTISAFISNIPYILLAVLMFGLLVFVHELGHFIAARAFKVKVNEFALGMGPTVLKHKRKDTVYALRLLPVGGFCAMEGEDEESEDPQSFNSKPVWQRCIILVAGAAMNFVLGVVILLLIYSSMTSHMIPQISDFSEGYPYASSEANVLQVGDTIKKVNGENIYVYSDVSMFLGRGNGETYDFVVERGGSKVEITGMMLERHEYLTEVEKTAEDGSKVTVTELQQRFGIEFTRKTTTFGDRINIAMMEALDFVRLIKLSFFDLFSGQASVSDMSGPIGIGTVITTTAKTSFTGMWMMVALIAINLGVMNLLPLPALDGGRVIFLLIELVRRKPINPKYEGVVHFVGLALILSLMVYVSFNDIMRLIQPS